MSLNVAVFNIYLSLHLEPINTVCYYLLLKI